MKQTPEKERLLGPVLALDLGEKRVGAAVSDGLLISITRLAPLARSNWKQLLLDVARLVKDFEAKTLVIGFPLGLDGNRGSAAVAVERVAEKFARSLRIPVYLQDERLTSVEAKEQLLAEGHNPKEIRELVDSQAAVIILADFIADGQNRILLSGSGHKQESLR